MNDSISWYFRKYKTTLKINSVQPFHANPGSQLWKNSFVTWTTFPSVNKVGPVKTNAFKALFLIHCTCCKLNRPRDHTNIRHRTEHQSSCIQRLGLSRHSLWWRMGSFSSYRSSYGSFWLRISLREVWGPSMPSVLYPRSSPEVQTTAIFLWNRIIAKSLLFRVYRQVAVLFRPLPL